MPVSLPVPTRNPGDVWTSATWNSYVRNNVNKLLNFGHRVLTVAQFAALGAVEDGDEVYLEVDATNGIMWHFRYVAAEASTYKWRFLGGPPMSASVATVESTASTSAVDLTTVGPSILIPRGGDYVYRWRHRASADAAGRRLYAVLNVNGALTDETVSLSSAASAGNADDATNSDEIAAAGPTSGSTVKQQYRVSAGTGYFGARRLSMIPRRIA